MASGLTHMLLTKQVLNVLPAGDLQRLLRAARDPFQAGCVAPDLPYASIADKDLFLTTQTKLADKFHYEKTSEIPILALERIRDLKTRVTPKELREYFAFFMGFISHIVADGVIHPFVRDKVGNYKGHETEHRKLEMKLDVLYYHHLTAGTGAGGEMNASDLYDELRNFEPSTYPNCKPILSLFAELINTVHNQHCDGEMIEGWLMGLHRMFGIAEGKHPSFFRNIGPINSFLLPDYEYIEKNKEAIMTLTVPIDRPVNFLRKPSVHFLEDVIPAYFARYIPILEKAYGYVYNDGPALTTTDIPPINLDTGKDLAFAEDLDQTPLYWRLA